MITKEKTIIWMDDRLEMGLVKNSFFNFKKEDLKLITFEEITSKIKIIRGRKIYVIDKEYGFDRMLINKVKKLIKVFGKNYSIYICKNKINVLIVRYKYTDNAIGFNIVVSPYSLQ